jgi:hypothetical protein
MSLAHLATVGQLDYNGYEFDGSSRVNVRAEFVYDDSGRTVLYHRHTITVHFFVHDASDTDGDFLSIRAKLSKPGKKLTFTGHGFGNDLIVNRDDGGGLRDVKWGPTPRIIAWDPVGSSKTCEAIWEVTTCVPVCDTQGVHRTTGVMSINYGVSFSIKNGFTTRTIDGHLEIAQTRMPVGLNPPDCADLYRHFVNPSQIPGFERSSDWRVSLDKSRIEFSIVDRQIESKNPYPTLVTRVSAEHDVSWIRSNRGTLTLRNRLTMDVDLPLGAPTARAWNFFGFIVAQRTQVSANSGKRTFLDEVSAREDIFGTSHSFSASWRVLMSLEEIFDFSQTGIWKPVTGTNWESWQASLAAVFDNRGYAELTQLPGNDLIIDLCGSGGATIPWNAGIPAPRASTPDQSPNFINQTPPPEKSYLDYQMDLQVVSQRPVVRQSTMQSPDVPPSQVDMYGGQGAQFGGPNQGQTADTLQQSGPGSFGIRIKGSAERAGHEIPCPAIQSVGSQTPVEVYKKYVCRSLGKCFGVPMFRAAWDIGYALSGNPVAASPLPNLEN